MQETYFELSFPFRSLSGCSLYCWAWSFHINRHHKPNTKPYCRWFIFTWTGSLLYYVIVRFQLINCSALVKILIFSYYYSLCHSHDWPHPFLLFQCIKLGLVQQINLPNLQSESVHFESKSLPLICGYIKLFGEIQNLWNVNLDDS